MKLLDLLSKINEDVTVWISTSIVTEDCLVFSEVTNIDEDMLNKIGNYEVREIYPEHYPARYCHGITIIVDKD